MDLQVTISSNSINSNRVRNSNWPNNVSRECRAGDLISSKRRAADRSKSSNSKPPRAESHNRSSNRQLSRAADRGRSAKPKGSFARLTFEMGGRDMSERNITQLFGLILGVIFACTLVLNVFAF